MKKSFFCLTAAAAFALFFAPLSSAQKISQIKEKQNEQIRINENYYFKYVFPAKPKLGMSVIKISVFDKDGNKSENFSIDGAYDMPQMRGHHSSGPISFQKNKDGDYLMPLNSVMRGKWEIFLRFKENDNILYEGAVYINI
ncbi:MAG: FixH family protein [Endomicrobium sp.]|jgi:ABC-type oligopeptide transport system substrate-binding subunit|nr:FixH family protein [Endomicrobium sp.]